ncbi:O-methyltransferase [Oceanobacillus chungangensis]|uniref:tRNA 5-hydroxyuridine methyltransferase n=1 Tax=Oceanobacillus chungangensis TaxID=1229152 RepID=A0A3D8PZT8_9BACI|nr:O-methyltransferase [Oceanobacillus chungangensis]RDW21710.1 SAM-dependent methyltransferase [Oceanobacillus chungangensis]
MDEQLNHYLEQNLPAQKEWVLQLEEQALKDQIPIMDSVGINFLMQLIRIKKPNRILEIGTAIGYSALRMNEAHPEAEITTIERDEPRYKQALENISNQEKQDTIHVIFDDALVVMENLIETSEQFDFIFIDAAKGQYKRFFELASQLLSDSGLIVTDNVLFRGYVANNDAENIPKRYRKMIEKLRDYNTFIINHPNFTSSIIPVGDGVAISEYLGGQNVG